MIFMNISKNECKVILSKVLKCILENHIRTGPKFKNEKEGFSVSSCWRMAFNKFTPLRLVLFYNSKTIYLLAFIFNTSL